MSKAWERLKDAVGIVNEHDAVKYAAARNIGPGIFLSYRAQDNGRGGHGAAWQVHRPGYKTDPDGHWMNNGHKTFNTYTYGADRAKTLAAAQEWAGSRYGVTEWGTIPGLPGAYFPKAVADLIKADLRQAGK